MQCKTSAGGVILVTVNPEETNDDIETVSPVGILIKAATKALEVEIDNGHSMAKATADAFDVKALEIDNGRSKALEVGNDDGRSNSTAPIDAFDAQSRLGAYLPEVPTTPYAEYSPSAPRPPASASQQASAASWPSYRRRRRPFKFSFEPSVSSSAASAAFIEDSVSVTSSAASAALFDDEWSASVSPKSAATSHSVLFPEAGMSCFVECDLAECDQPVYETGDDVLKCVVDYKDADVAPIADITEAQSAEATAIAARLRLLEKQRLFGDAALWISFFAMGAANSVPFLLVMTAASSLAIDFDKEATLPGVITLGVVGLGLVVQVLLAQFSTKFSDTQKMAFKSVCMGAGMLFIAFGVTIVSVAVLFVGLSLVGIGYNGGEVILLQYMRNFPAQTTGAFSTGTGVAGIAASVGYLFLRGDDTSNASVFMVTALLVPVSLATFYGSQQWLKWFGALANSSDASRQSSPSSSTRVDATGFDVDFRDLQKLARCFKIAWRQMACLFLQPFTSFTIMVGLLPVAMRSATSAAASVHAVMGAGSVTDTDNAETTEHPVELTFVFFFIGLFAGRFSSVVSSFRTANTMRLATFQLVNLGVWFAEAKWQFLPFTVQVIYIFIVGVVDGMLFSNTYFALIRRTTYSRTRETRRGSTVGYAQTRAEIIGDRVSGSPSSELSSSPQAGTGNRDRAAVDSIIIQGSCVVTGTGAEEDVDAHTCDEKDVCPSIVDEDVGTRIVDEEVGPCTEAANADATGIPAATTTVVQIAQSPRGSVASAFSSCDDFDHVFVEDGQLQTQAQQQESVLVGVIDDQDRSLCVVMGELGASLGVLAAATFHLAVIGPWLA